MTDSIKIECSKSNGTQELVEFFGDMQKIFIFIENYEGDDLGNELICQDFISDTKHTGIIMEN